ncbi:MAG: Cell division protein FtsZ [Candidatus Fermentimicrarchaeum limneticum]|uniref:Cell division protein FtsZ n=1 Tax=Fermentimicrarchaeum limneticum TaxID=2795018 RepID=A0A7D6BUK4_FERL1|nr:MAG: Cell division protein FtsZ [Candidatus Fermentimicrarchaeum limneticum]
MEGLIKSVIGERDSSNLDDLGGTEQIKIVTVGVGGAGNNTINRLIRAGIKGCNLLAVNTDKQHLNMIDEKAKKLLIGKTLTKGLGAGGYPEIGIKAAEIDRPMLEKELSGSHLVFLCAGMGGGTGTGATPVIAEIAKEQGAITVAMVTYPFNLERARRVKADEGIAKLRKVTDSVIILDNNRLVKIVPNLPMNEAFSVADEILAKAIGGLVWTITQPSLINIDFADVRSIMGGGGVGFIAVGEGKGTDKVTSAAEGVLKNRLLDVDFEGATGALIHISGGSDLTLGDAIKAGEIVTERMDPHANVKWGARLIPGYDGKIEIVAIVTGVKGASIMGKPLEETRESTPYSDIEVIG